METAPATAPSPAARALAARVDRVRRLTDATFVIRLERHGLSFDPGQYVTVGLPGRIDRREYSIYSGAADPYLEILVREIPGGLVSGQLARLEPGDGLEVEGPFGFFTVAEDARVSRRFLMIATGTGISPCHRFAGSYPELDYTLLHGVQTSKERYEHAVFDPEHMVACVSRERGGDYEGRVTDYLREHPADPWDLCYLCGNCDMIYDVFDSLRGQGVPPRQMFTEVYF